jgi:hypothetical protein
MPAATTGGGAAAVSSGGARRAAAAEVRKHRCALTLREVRSALLKAGKDVDAIWRQIEAIAIKAVLSAEERLVFYRCACVSPLWGMHQHWLCTPGSTCLACFPSREYLFSFLPWAASSVRWVDRRNGVGVCMLWVTRMVHCYRTLCLR